MVTNNTHRNRFMIDLSRFNYSDEENVRLSHCYYGEYQSSGATT